MRDTRARWFALADVDESELAAGRRRFSVSRVTTEYRECSMTPASIVNVVEVVTGNRQHFGVSWDARRPQARACEKTVHNDYSNKRKAAERRGPGGLRRSSAFTFRYAAAIQYAKE